LFRVEWDGDQSVCDLVIELTKPTERWRFRAFEPMSVLVQEDEGQVCSLWSRRDQCCKGAGGFLVVANSPMIDAIALNEGHIGDFARSMQHFVLGTDSAVAHVLCAEPPIATRCEAS
jgi:hypothetical protein